ncbi:MAG: cell division protein SepF [Lachnospiraceae bacterium]
MGVLDKFLNVMKLNDDYDDDDYLDDEIDDEFEEERPAKKHFSRKTTALMKMMIFRMTSRSRKPEKPKHLHQRCLASERPRQIKTQPVTSSKVSPIRPRKSSGMEVCVIKPKSMEDAREITETLLGGCTVVLNMEGLDLDIAQRIIDFSSGSCYAINGTLQKISGYIFIITPSTVDVSGDIQEILGGSFDVPSVHSSRF